MQSPSLSVLALLLALAPASGCASSRCASSAAPTMPTELGRESTRETHLEAAKTLVLTTVSPETWDEMVRTMTAAVVDTNAELRPLRPVFERFFAEYVTRDAFAVRAAQLYTSRFSELELRQMIWFYSTETGKKALVSIPALMQAGGQIGQQIVQEHAADLERMLGEYVAAHPEAAAPAGR